MVVKAADLNSPGIWRVNVGGMEIGIAIQPRELATEHRNLRVKCNDGLIAAYLHQVNHRLTVCVGRVSGFSRNPTSTRAWTTQDEFVLPAHPGPRPGFAVIPGLTRNPVRLSNAFF